MLEYAGNDLLQVAEYLYLKCDRHIGPIRHALEQALVSAGSPVLSAVHVELVNLGAAQVYTTNYDDLIENTYRELGLPVTTVVLPKDVALADTERNQIVKYHGDLRHESTLVLTESSYYKRLDFESPMDLKFRSDLLGKSVLFMGYSFRDINIRIIWFKLMEMMRDIPEADRRPSYIVRTESNSVLEDLYGAVGLKTIVLHDGPDDLSADDRTNLLAEFLMRLGKAASPDTIPGQGMGRFVSTAAISAARSEIDSIRERIAKLTVRAGYMPFGFQQLDGVTQILGSRVPGALFQDARDVIWRALESDLVPPDTLESIMEKFGSGHAVTQYTVRVLMSPGGEDSERHSLLNTGGLDWREVWSSRLTDEDVDFAASRLQAELEFIRTERFDEDIAYVADVAKRITLGQIYELEDPPGEKLKHLQGLLDEAAQLLPIDCVTRA